MNRVSGDSSKPQHVDPALNAQLKLPEGWEYTPVPDPETAQAAQRVFKGIRAARSTESSFESISSSMQVHPSSENLGGILQEFKDPSEGSPVVVEMPVVHQDPHQLEHLTGEPAPGIGASPLAGDGFLLVEGNP